ncbi:sensor histidine kinase [Microbacterium sp. P01]|uniref:sensor histidine kinase n=1 Tax=Microbacterium sp. P01 TaxID=3366261 RepID=UPI00367190DF
MSGRRLGARRPGLSIRVKLASSYAAFLVVAGIALFIVGFLLLRFVPDGNLSLDGGSWAPNRGDLLEVFVRYAWWAMALLAAIGLGGGWLLAGAVLRPLDRMTEGAALVRDGDLGHRIDLDGRRDELTDLSDTLDAMLDRVQRTVDAERVFAANASHELRTPHAIIRTLVEVAQADPGGRDVELLLRRIAATNERAIASAEALLTIARVEGGGALRTAPLDLAAVVSDTIEESKADAAARGIALTASIEPSVVNGDCVLLRQLASNLLGNALAHNVDGGWVRVVLSTAGVLTVSNGGPVLSGDVVATLTDPFVRGAGRARTAGGHDGAGLGLTIVASIVRAHAGTLSVTAPASGGLHVRVDLAR